MGSITLFILGEENVVAPFYAQWDFWINAIFGGLGLLFAILAFREARDAKKAAVEAGRSVKLQTTTIELTEVSQKLDRISPNIEFSEARDLLSEISRRVRRAISPYSTDPGFSDAITAVREALTSAKESLTSVRPTNPEQDADPFNSVYFGVESELANINNCIADLLGLFEMKSVGTGDDNAET